MKSESKGLELKSEKSEAEIKQLYEDKLRLQNEIDEFKMLASSKSDETKSFKQKLEACTKRMLKEDNLFKNEKEILNHRVETSCTEKNSTTEISSKNLKKRRKFKLFCF